MTDRRHTLIVVGAAGGMGRWLCSHLFIASEWDQVLLLDREPAIQQLREDVAKGRVVFGFGCPTRTGGLVYNGNVRVVDDTGGTIDLSTIPAYVCLAVPQSELANIAGFFLPLLHNESVVLDISSAKVAALATLRSGRSDVTLFGIHPLFGPALSSIDGQTVVVCPSVSAPDSHLWLTELVEAAGGIVQISTPHDHDRIMAYVQAASHQALLVFADVIANSGHDIASELWKFRTPVFETLLSMASRVLSPGQESTIASIQISTDGPRIAAEFGLAQQRLTAALQTDEATRIASYISSTRDAFGGTFFTTLQQASNLAIDATQVTRTRLAGQRRTGDVIAIKHRGPDLTTRLVVGRISELTPTTVTVEELLVGPKGRAALLVGPGVANASRLGLSASTKTRTTRFGLAHVTILSAFEMDRDLEEFLGRVSVDLRLLVPESVAGRAAVAVCKTVESVDSATLISESVRLGQREVVARIWVRSDRDLAETKELVGVRIDEVYAWPSGIAARLADKSAISIAFLGPMGTFSELAGHQAAEVLGLAEARLLPLGTFSDVIAAVVDGAAPLGVLPITNSSSGLVELAAEGLLLSRKLAAGGVVDVPVRFDAYVCSEGSVRLGSGSPVYSHPQALSQCSRFIGRLGRETVPCDSTAAACLEVSRRRDGVALAAPGQGERHGLTTFERDVGDLSGVLTRFLIVSRLGLFVPQVENDPTCRWLWLLEPSAIAAIDEEWGEGARFDELIVGASGRALLITTKSDYPLPQEVSFALGYLPWSPRTPIVRV